MIIKQEILSSCEPDGKGKLSIIQLDK